MTQYQTFPDAPGGSMSFEKLKSLFLPNLAGKSFLDVGCNEGFFCGYAQFNGASRVVGIDLNEAFTSRAKTRFPGCEFLTQSWASLPDGQFDVIVMLSAIHYADDQRAMIETLVQKLAPDGILVLEMGVVNSDKPEWVAVERSIDTRLFPTHALLPQLLKPYAWKWIAHSVNQGGDPTPRSVIHISKRKPVAYLLMQPPGSGKSSIARDVFVPADIKILHSDVFISQIANGSAEVPENLREVITENTPFLELDLTYYRIFGSGLGSAFLDAILKGSEHQDFVFDGFVPDEYKQEVMTHLEKLGCMPVVMSWNRPQANLLSKKAVNASVLSYENFLRKNSEIQDDPIIDGLTHPQGCLDLINFTAAGIEIHGWAAGADGKLPSQLIVKIGDDFMTQDTGAAIERPDVQQHLGLPHSQLGFALTLIGTPIKSMSELLAHGFSVSLPSGEPLYISKKIMLESIGASQRS